MGRERFATVLLMKLTETVILWLSEDQTFGGEIEGGQTPLTSFRLQQVCFPFIRRKEAHFLIHILLRILLFDVSN